DLIILTDAGTAQRVPVVLIIPAAGPAPPLDREAAACTPTQLILVATSLSQSFSVAAGWPTPIEVRVVDDCANLFSAGSVIVSFSNGDSPISLSYIGDGRWTGTWTGRNTNANVAINIRASSRDQQVTGSAVFGGALQENPTPPV